MYRDYKVSFSYIVNGRRFTEYDVTFQCCASDAVREITHWYGDLDGFRIDTVYADHDNFWCIDDIWE